MEKNKMRWDWMVEGYCRGEWKKETSGLDGEVGTYHILLVSWNAGHYMMVCR